jgi:hypothetical protein
MMQRVAAAASSMDEEIDRLFDLPLEEFVAARNTLAKKLTQAGEKAKGEEVKKLPKPSVPAWALNQLSRKQPELLRAYFEASDRLFRAQVRAMSAGGADPDFRPATEGQRAALGALVEAAGRALEDGGHKDSRAMVERVAMTLRSAVLDEAARRRLREGRMIEDLAEAGFDAFAASLGAMPEPPKPSAGEREARRAELERAEKARAREEESARAREERTREGLRAAKEALREAEREAGAAKKATIAAVRAVEAKRKTAEEARRALKAAEEALEEARAAFGEAQQELEAAEAEAKNRERGAQAAETSVDRARRALAGLTRGAADEDED